MGIMTFVLLDLFNSYLLDSFFDSFPIEIISWEVSYIDNSGIGIGRGTFIYTPGWNFGKISDKNLWNLRELEELW